MGTMSCGRNGCNNQMCHHMIDIEGYNYICTDCISELRQLQEQNLGMNIKDIERFMETPKTYDEYSQPLIDLDKIIRSIR